MVNFNLYNFAEGNHKEWWNRSDSSKDQTRSSKKLKHQIKKREASKRSRAARKKNRNR